MKSKLLSVLLTAAFLTACQSGQVINPQTVAQIQRNVTTQDQIVATFGEPDEVFVNTKMGTRTLIYKYKDSNEGLRAVAAVAGGAAGALLGSQIGGGSARYYTGAAGGVAGAAAAGSMITTREKKQALTVVVSLRTGRVIDYNYVEHNSKNAGLRPSLGPSSTLN